MGVVLIIIGTLFALFGGGCILLYVAFAFSGPAMDFLFQTVALGLAPLVIGIFAIRAGIAMRRSRSTDDPRE